MHRKRGVSASASQGSKREPATEKKPEVCAEPPHGIGISDGDPKQPIEKLDRVPSRTLRSGLAERLTQSSDFAESLAESEAGEASVHSSTRSQDRSSLDRRFIARPQTVLSTTRFSRSGWVRRAKTPSDRNLISRAELRRIACRKGSKSYFLLLRIPLKSLAFWASRFHS